MFSKVSRSQSGEGKARVRALALGQWGEAAGPVMRTTVGKGPSEGPAARSSPSLLASGKTPAARLLRTKPLEKLSPFFLGSRLASF